MPRVTKIWPPGSAKAFGTGMSTRPKVKGNFWNSDCCASS